MELLDVSKKFENIVFENISYKFEKGKIYSIFGVNGSGKTTLLNILNGNLESDTGQVKTGSDNTMFISENTIPFNYISGWDFIEMTLNFRKKKVSNESVEELVSLFQLNVAINHNISTYSKGMQYKLFLIIAILSEPSILLLDEPFAELDMITVSLLKNILDKIKQNKIIVFSTHVPDISFQLSDEILLLTQQRIYGKKNDFMHTNDLKRYIYDLMSSN